MSVATGLGRDRDRGEVDGGDLALPGDWRATLVLAEERSCAFEGEERFAEREERRTGGAAARPAVAVAVVDRRTAGIVCVCEISQNTNV